MDRVTRLAAKSYVNLHAPTWNCVSHSHLCSLGPKKTQKKLSLIYQSVNIHRNDRSSTREGAKNYQIAERRRPSKPDS